MNIPPIAALVAGVPRSLGCYAPVLAEIEEALQSSGCSLMTVAEAIEKDPDLTARLLRLGNSSFYGFSMRMATVAEAISLIGLQEVEDLIVVSSIIEQFAGISPEFIDMGAFWQHSLACGIGARAVAMTRRLPKADKFFVAGLLHDVGRLVLYSQAPQASAAIFQVYHQRPMLLREAEAQVLGYDHAQIGEALLRQWSYPDHLVEAVACHHAPSACDRALSGAVIVHLSDHLVNAMQIGSSGERYVPPLQSGAWERLDLAPEALPSLIGVIDDQFKTMLEVYLNPRSVPAPA